MRKMINITLLILLTLFAITNLAGCGQSENKTRSETKETKETVKAHEVATPFQLQPPKAGDEIAIVETELGTIKFKLFNEQSPQSVDAFRDYVDSEYYTMASFDRIEPGMINQIDYKGTFPDEVDEAKKTYYPHEDSPNIKNIKGAVSLIYQFGEFVSPSLAFVMGGEVNQEELDSMAYLGETSYNEDVVNEYRESGGMPSFDGRFTVIGQVYEGYDVLEAINQLPVEEASDNKSHHLPKEPLAIKRITIEIYK